MTAPALPHDWPVAPGRPPPGHQCYEGYWPVPCDDYCPYRQDPR